MPVAATPSLESIRALFPALDSGFAFMDNAGGSQVPVCVADAVRDYMVTCPVTVGASYPASRLATETVQLAHETVNVIFGGENAGKVIFGASSSALCRMLSDCYAEILEPGDEVVVAESGHEANVFPWVVLKDRGVTVKVWSPEPETGRSEPGTLKTLLSDRTRIVAFPQVSNVLGAHEDVEAIVKLAHDAGARVVLDSVAYAPHQALDVARWGVDFCVFSCYKVFGPHMGALWGRDDALAELTGRNHPFIPRDRIPSKFELGGVLSEGCAGLVALRRYFRFLAGRDAAWEGGTSRSWTDEFDDRSFDRAIIEDAFSNAAVMEAPLTARLLDFLNSKAGVRIVGPKSTGSERVGIVSFRHRNLSPEEIVAAVDPHGIGMRHGSFYSPRLLRRMGFADESVARVSFAHYNTPGEVDRLIAALDPVL